MPIYEYKCSACDHQLEAIQKMADDVLVHCPECQAPKLKKQLSAAAFKLTGTGWYETDFKNSGKKPQENNKADKQANGQADAQTSEQAASKKPVKTSHGDNVKTKGKGRQAKQAAA